MTDPNWSQQPFAKQLLPLHAPRRLPKNLCPWAWVWGPQTAHIKREKTLKQWIRAITFSQFTSRKKTHTHTILSSISIVFEQGGPFHKQDQQNQNWRTLPFQHVQDNHCRTGRNGRSKWKGVLVLGAKTEEDRISQHGWNFVKQICMHGLHYMSNWETSRSKPAEKHLDFCPSRSQSTGLMMPVVNESFELEPHPVGSICPKTNEGSLCPRIFGGWFGHKTPTFQFWERKGTQQFPLLIRRIPCISSFLIGYGLFCSQRFDKSGSNFLILPWLTIIVCFRLGFPCFLNVALLPSRPSRISIRTYVIVSRGISAVSNCLQSLLVLSMGRKSLSCCIGSQRFVYLSMGTEAKQATYLAV